MNELDIDLWLAQRIAFHANRRPDEVLAIVFGGTTNRCVRRDRFRALILEHGLAESVVGKKDGTPETYRDHFQRRYAEQLTPVPRETHFGHHNSSEVTA